MLHFVEQIKKTLQKEIKYLTFEPSDPSTCLQFLLFLNNRSIVHFCEWGWVGGWMGGGLWMSKLFDP